MAQFNCRLMTTEGKIVVGEYEAKTKSELASSLQVRGYSPIEITEKKRSFATKSLGSSKMKLKERVLFCRQMSTLLKSGVPLIQCFDIVASQTNSKRFEALMQLLSKEVRAGAVLSIAMTNQTGVFPEMLIRMVEIGEATGDMTGILERMAIQYESESRLKKRVRSALSYPVALLFIAIVACVFMLVKVVPTFADMFASLDQELPAITRVLLAVSGFITKRWYLVLLITILLGYSLKKVLAKTKIKKIIDKFKITFIGIRSPVQKIMCAQFSRTLSTLIVSGVPVVQSMAYARRNVHNLYVSEILHEAEIGLQKGKGISEQLEKYTVFPKLLVSMIAIGEVSGNLEEMLLKTADYYDEEMDAAMAQLMALLEPLMILFVGLLIGVIVFALYAPMFSMVSAVSDKY